MVASVGPAVGMRQRDANPLFEDSPVELQDVVAAAPAVADEAEVPNLLAMVRLTSSRAISSFSAEGAGGGVRLSRLALVLVSG